MKKRILSTLALGMAVAMATSVPVMAASSLVDSTGSTAADVTNVEKDGKDTNQAKATIYSPEITADAATNEVLVYASQASTFSVVIPKTIILDGTKGEVNKGDYVVTTKGNIGGAETVHVVPDASFAMKQAGKVDITATVAQPKTNFVVTERTAESMVTPGLTDENTAKGVDAAAGATSAGVITVEGLTAGSWAGQFNFAIEIVTDAL